MIRKLFFAVVIVAVPVVLDSISPGKAEAASGCGGAQFTYEGRAWCTDLNQSINEWVRTYVTCSATGSTKYWGVKIYTDGGNQNNNYSVAYCGLGYGTVTSVATIIGH